MVKPTLPKFASFAFAFLMGFASFAEASESGTLAYRAQKSLKAGKIAKSYSQLERALLASRKEADLGAESRILIAMGQIRTMSLDFAFADSILANVRTEAMDRTTKVVYAKSQAALKNAQENYQAAASICKSISKDDLKKAADELQAAFYSECGIAYAATGKSEDAKDALKMIDKRTDDETLLYAWTEARIANFNAPAKADSLYKIAEERAIADNRPYTTATILYHRAKLLEKSDKKTSEDLYLRSKNAFELMGLPNNAKRSEK